MSSMYNNSTSDSRNGINTTLQRNKPLKNRFDLHPASLNTLDRSRNINSQVFYVYCSPKCKKICFLLWRIFLLFYLITIPVLFFFLLKETCASINKLDSLEHQLKVHIKQLALNEKKDRTRRKVNTDEKGDAHSYKSAMIDFIESYKVLPKVEKRFGEKILYFEEKLKKINTRLNFFSSSTGNELLHKYINNRSCPCKDPLLNQTSLLQQENVFKNAKDCDDKSFAVYTQWGSVDCSGNQTSLLYSGYTSTTPLSDRGGGSNYLCLTEKPKYERYDQSRSSVSAQIDGAKYGISYARIDRKTYERKVIQCAVCQVQRKSEIVMVPASHKCPTAWSVLYTGFLSTQNTNTRTEFICIDNKSRPDLVSINMRVKVSILDTTHASDCNILPCGRDRYLSGASLSCVICTK